jgi:nitrite reductase/ring-hydroxylating ferredoxin subunit
MLGFFKALCGICETKPLNSDLWELEGNKVRVKLNQMPEPLDKGAATYIKDSALECPMLILRTEDDTYLAFANRCTHGNRKLDPVKGQQILRCCSVGHSTFNYKGEKLNGPATGNLTMYPVEMSDDDLVITL